MQAVTPKGTVTPEEKAMYSDLDKDKNATFSCAEASLAHYNLTNSSNYKLIEATKSNSFFYGWVWHHCLFKAAPESSSVPELFFAELHGLGWNKFHVVTIACVPPHTATDSYDCKYCFGMNILHPVPTLSQDPDALFSEGRIGFGKPGKYQDAKSYESVKAYLRELSEVQPYGPKYKPEVFGHPVRSSEAGQQTTDGVNTLICKGPQQTTATDATSSHSPVSHLVDGASMSSKGHHDDAGNVQNKDNVEARSSLKGKSLEGVNTQTCEDVQQNIATDATSSDASGTGSEDIHARSCVKRKASEGVS